MITGKKPSFKISARERWMVAALPALLIFGAYYLKFMGDVTAELEKQQNRVLLADKPLPPVAPSQTLGAAKKALDEAKQAVTGHETHIEQLEAKIAALKNGGSDAAPAASAAAADERDAARLIERVEAVFARNGLTPLVSEGNDNDADARGPVALMSMLTGAPSIASGTGLAGSFRVNPSNPNSARVWHFIFDDKTPRFARAIKDLGRDAPMVVPLSLNFAYNPANDGVTRLLELWILY